MTKSDDIMVVLKALKDSDERISACMVARRGLEGLMMFPEHFKEEVSDVWEPLSRSLDDVLAMVARYSPVGMRRAYTEVLGYGAYFLVLENSDTALIALVKSKEPLTDALALVAEMDSSARDIYKIMGLT